MSPSKEMQRPAPVPSEELKPPLPRKGAVLISAGGLAALGAASWVYSANAPRIPGTTIVRIELGGSRNPVDAAAVPSMHSAVLWDFAFIAGYAAALAAGLYLARVVANSATARRVAVLGASAAGGAVVADCLENVMLLTVRANGGGSGWRGFALNVAAGCATVKFSLLIPAALIALYGMGLTLVRALINSRAQLEKLAEAPFGLAPLPVEDDPDFPACEGPAESASEARWRRGYRIPQDLRGPAEGRGPTGFCLSGGGVRSASVALGALQTLRPRLLAADHLVSVSGGGYTAGALTLALTGAEPDDNGEPLRPPQVQPPNELLHGQVIRDPEQALMPGSVDEDHIRNRSAYLANGSVQLLAALGLILFHLLLTMAVLFGPAVVLGVLAGWFYKYVPIADFGVTASGPAFTFSTSLFSIPGLAALGLLALLSMGMWLGHQHALGHRPSHADHLLLAAKVATWLTAIVALVVVVVPVLICVAHWILGSHQAPIAIAGPVGGVTLTYLATLASIGWRNRKAVTKAVKAAADGSAVPAAVPTGLLQRLLVIAALTLLVAGWLLLFAGNATTWGVTGALWAAVAVAAVVGFLGLVVDETTLSLHPFYRRRLAVAFGARALRRSSDEHVVARGYEQGERTQLSRYGQVADGIKFPEITFAATANINDDDRTPPGRSGTPYTFNSKWVGGPHVGYIETAKLEECCPPRLQRDLTVHSAMAISGAAFASTMGRLATWHDVLLTVTGARLGAWLPNPAHLIDAAARATHDNWLIARPPRVRRLNYLLREVFHTYPHGAPLVMTTDGGHYDNLGLLELLRRGCDEIYCIDASGDAPPTAGTLAAVIALAHDELGVTIKLDDDPFAAEPGRGDPIEPKDPLSALNTRLSETPVITGTFTYPAVSGYRGPDGRPRKGKLIVGKALLWRELPYSLLSYAVRHPVFPHDSTGDQWFDADQFSAYSELGRNLGARIDEKAAAGGFRSAPPRGPFVPPPGPVAVAIVEVGDGRLSTVTSTVVEFLTGRGLSVETVTNHDGRTQFVVSGADAYWQQELETHLRSALGEIDIHIAVDR